MNIDREKALEGARAIGKLEKPDAALIRLMLEIQKQAQSEQVKSLVMLTVGQIAELAEYAGLKVGTDGFNVDDLEAEISIQPCPDEGVINDDGEAEFYSYVAFISEYPEEGVFPLGEIQKQAAQKPGDTGSI